MHAPDHNDTGWSRPHRPPASMEREELLEELERARHELTTYRAEVRQQMNQLAESRQQLEASRDRYADLYDLAPIGYVTLDRNGAIADINLIGAEVLGVERRHLLGRPLVGYVAPADRRALLDHMRHCRTAETDLVTSELWLRPADGEPIYAQLISRPALTDSARYFRTALIDQTQRYHAEEAARRHEAALQQRTREAEQRSGQLQALAAELTQAEQRERRRLAQMLHDHFQQILVATKMQAGVLSGADQQTAERVGDQLTELLDEAIESSRNLSHELCPPVLYDRGLAEALRWLARHEHEKLGLTVDVEAAPEAEPANQDLQAFLFQSVRELLLNAVKHGGANRVRLEMHRRAGALTLSVEDNGAGCDPDQMFQQPETGGFGLFSIQERLTMLGGSMSARSAPGAGCGVTLRLAAESESGGEGGGGPEAARGEAAEPGGSPRRRPEEAPAGGGTGAGHRSIRVMLVDDHKIVREGLMGILRAEPDIEPIAEASDGREAVEMVDQARPDVIVMDVSMPRMDGEEATRIILSDHPGVRVIGLSMHNREDLNQAMKEAGASAYLTKGGPASELVGAIREHAGGTAVG